MNGSNNLNPTKTSDQPATTDQSLPDIDRRLSVLEERTKPEPKSLIKHITEWGGVATFVLALLYTFPLGVWDRFFATQVDAVRNLTIKLTEIDTDYFKTTQSSPTNQIQNQPSGQALASAASAAANQMIVLSIQAKKAALITRDKPLILKWRDSLTPIENELLGFQLATIGDVESAMTLYGTALKKATAENNYFLIADLYRMQAQVFATPGTDLTNATKARQYYTQSMDMLLKKPTGLYSAAMLANEWANFEESQGNGACAEFLARWAIQQVTPISPNEGQLWAQMMEAVHQRPGYAMQPAENCQKEAVRFVDEIKLIPVPASPWPASVPAGAAPQINNAQ